MRPPQIFKKISFLFFPFKFGHFFLDEISKKIHLPLVLFLYFLKLKTEPKSVEKLKSESLATNGCWICQFCEWSDRRPPCGIRDSYHVLGPLNIVFALTFLDKKTIIKCDKYDNACVPFLRCIYYGFVSSQRRICEKIWDDLRAAWVTMGAYMHAGVGDNRACNFRCQNISFFSLISADNFWKYFFLTYLA